jgi:predicted lipoprotein with Yx(FWY)xxD motif
MFHSTKRYALAILIMAIALIALSACAQAPIPVPTAVPPAAPTAAPTTAPTEAAMSSGQAPMMPANSIAVQLVKNDKLGNILVETHGMTLYTFKNDKPGESNCADACAALWPPLTVPQGTVPTASKDANGMLGVLERADGTYQVTYNDMPLYLFAQDTKAGDTNGQGYKNLWSVVTTATNSVAMSMPATAGATDWMMAGFPTILGIQDITPGKAATVYVGPYTIQVPADAFSTPVRFVVLSGNLASFTKAPAGQKPVLAFAFNVRNLSTNELITKFDKPVVLTAKDQSILTNSKYYNVAANGTFTDNATGLQAKSGELTHPIAGTPVGWVITSSATP